MTMTKASTTYFNRVAGDWDQLRSGYFTDEVRQAAIRKAYLRPEMVVADMGTGTGFMAAGLAPLVQGVYAVDGSAAMLEKAKENLKESSNIVFQEADGSSIPLPEDSLDVVFANMYLHHCADPMAAINEMVRVIRPGGRLVITDLDTHNHEWMKAEMADEWLGFDRSQIKDWLKQAGLVNRVVDCTGECCCSQSEESGGTNGISDEAKISIFVASGSRPVKGTREAIQADYAMHALSEKNPNAAIQAEPETKTTSSCCGAREAKTTSSCCGAPEAKATSLCCGASEQSMTEFPTEGLSAQPTSALDIGYTKEELGDIPESAADVSLGCGNPTAMANLKPGEVVLDIGSGGGIDAFLASKRVGPSGRVIGVDMTPEMLARARKNAKEGGYDNVEFRQGRAEAMPVENQAVNVMISNCVINLCEDKGQVFDEAFRVLKTGGRLEVSDIVTEPALPNDYREDPKNWSDCVGGALSKDEYLDLIAQAGFKDITSSRSKWAYDSSGIKIYSLAVSAYKM
jgi:arsenite methyltransferase